MGDTPHPPCRAHLNEDSANARGVCACARGPLAHADARIVLRRASFVLQRVKMRVPILFPTAVAMVATTATGCTGQVTAEPTYAPAPSGAAEIQRAPRPERREVRP
jgi:hypothetical protein